MKKLKLLLFATAGILALAGCDKKETSKGYTVDFNTHGGTPVETLENVRTIQSSPETTREGYTFLGWFESALESAEEYTFPYKVTKDMTMHAKWSRVSFTVEFDTDGGTPVDTLTDVTVINEAPVTTRHNCTFTGWYTSRNAATPVTFPYVVDHDQTLYAKWETDTSVIIIDGNAIEYIWTDEVMSKKATIGSGSYYTDIYGLKRNDGLYLYAEQFVLQGKTHASDWWENNNIEFRFGNEILLPDQQAAGSTNGTIQYWFSSLHGGANAHGQLGYKDVGVVDGLFKYQFEMFIPWGELPVTKNDNVLFSAGCNFTGDNFVHLDSWGRLRADQLDVYDEIKENGIEKFAGLGNNFYERTGDELLDEPVEGVTNDWNSRVVNYKLDGTESWELRVDLFSSNNGGTYNDCGWVGEVYSQDFAQGGWTFRQDWWGWASWSRGTNNDHAGNAGPHGDFINCDENEIFSIMQEKNVTIFVTFDADMGRIGVRGVYTSTKEGHTDNKVFIAYSSSVISFSGDMFASFGVCNGLVRINSVQLLSGTLVD